MANISLEWCVDVKKDCKLKIMQVVVHQMKFAGESWQDKVIDIKVKVIMAQYRNPGWTSADWFGWAQLGWHGCHWAWRGFEVVLVKTEHFCFILKEGSPEKKFFRALAKGGGDYWGTVFFLGSLPEVTPLSIYKVAWLLNLRGEGSSHLSGLYHSPTFQVRICYGWLYLTYVFLFLSFGPVFFLFLSFLSGLYHLFLLHVSLFPKIDTLFFFHIVLK